MFQHCIRIALSSLFIWSSIFLQPSIERANARAGNLLSLKPAETYALGSACSPTQIEVLPSNPTTNDNVTVRLSGQWSDACVPRNPVVTVSGSEIRINTANSGQVCATVITPWSLNVPVGRLAARTYQVIATHSSPGGQCELGRKSFTIATQPVTIVDHRVSGGPVSTTSCVAPPSKSNFAPTDTRAYQWTSFSGIRAGDVVRRDFISPNGSLFFTSSDVFPSSGSNCAWDSIPIAGNPAASLPGNWQVRVFYNGALILTENFTIGTQPVTVLDHKMTGGPIPTNCASPTPKFNFASTDARAYQWTYYSGARAGDFVKVDYIQPNGTLYYSDQGNLSNSGNVCVFSWMDIAGQPAALLPGNWQARVFYGSTMVLTENFSITIPGNPAPTLTALSPNSVVARSQGFTLTATGSNFVPGSVVRWNGADRATTYVSATQLLAAIPAGDIAAGGVASVTVINPPPGGGASNALSFTIITNQPTTGAAVIIDGTDANEHGGTSSGANVRGWLYMQKALENVATQVSPGAAKVVVDLGTSTGTARNAINSAFNLSSLPGAGWTITHVDGAANITNWLSNLSTANTGILYIPTYNLTGGDLDRLEMAAINAQAGRIAGFINRGSGNGGALFAMGEVNSGNDTGAWLWLRELFPGIVPNTSPSTGGVSSNLTLTPDGAAAFPGLTNAHLAGADPWHNYFTGDLGTLKVLATAPQGNDIRQIIIGGVGIVVTPPLCPAITSFNPTSGLAGTNVVITGRNFSGVDSVKFANNVAAAFTLQSDTQITATVPNGAVNGPITVSKPDCDAQSNASFTVEPGQTSRAVRVVCGTASPGGTVMVPIVLDSQGDENALGFSLNFDPAILSNPRAATGSDAAGAILNVNSSQVAQGRLGIALALPSGQSFATGARQIAVVTFTVANTNATSTRIDFGDAPISRQVSNANAQLLNAGYQGCTLRIGGGPTDGYEADVTPRPSGKNNGTIAITDWVQVGRFAAGLDTPSAGAEFQRADCAPRDTKGDGQISITDWVQAGRYAAGLDAPQTAGGPLSATALFGNAIVAQAKAERAHGRELRVVQATFARGQESVVVIEIEAVGDENAIGFSLNFDPNVVRYVSASAGDGMADALLIPNTNQAAAGRVGIAIALPAGKKVAAGKRTVIYVRFASLTSSTAATTTMAFDDQPIRRQVSGVDANALTAEYINGSITIRNAVANVSAASFKADLAPESIVAAFGSAMATTTVAATELPLPTTLAGTTVKVKDSAGVERPAQLFFVAPAQVNYLMPAGMATGAATVTITSSDGAVSVGTVNLTSVAPSLFSANADGQGVATAALLRVKADGSQSFEPVSRYDDTQKRFVAVPIDLGPESDQVFLILFGTGLRNRSGLAAVSAAIGGLPAQVLYVGSQGALAGMDQINLRLPRGLAGRGLVDLIVTLDGRTANTVQASVR